MESTFEDAAEYISGDLKVIVFEKLLERELVLLYTLPDVALSNGLNSSAAFLLAAYQHSSADEQLVLAKILNKSSMITELVKILSSMWKGGQ